MPETGLPAARTSTFLPDIETLRRRYRHARDTAKFWRRQARRGIRSPTAFLAIRRYRKAVRNRDWISVRARLPELARMAQDLSDRQLLAELRLAADQVGEFTLGARLETAIAGLAGARRDVEWNGEPLEDSRLVIDFVETSKQGAATGLRFTGHAAEASRQATQTVIVTEQRLVPLYSRTFPAAEVVAGPASIAPHGDLPQYVANMRVLRNVVGTDPETLGALFQPMKADMEISTRLRETYRGGTDLPLVGISWRSTHHGKDLPSLDHWVGMMRHTEAVFVDIQYGERQHDLDYMASASGKEIVSDTSVDQLRDMDRFAAQLCALDAIVSISCTGAHLACALDVPTVLVRDDWFRRDWPVLSQTTPWCPSAFIAGKDGRRWEDVFETIPHRLQTIFARRAASGRL